MRAITGDVCTVHGHRNGHPGVMWRTGLHSSGLDLLPASGLRPVLCVLCGSPGYQDGPL
jgi:hypothetical protein